MAVRLYSLTPIRKYAVAGEAPRQSKVWSSAEEAVKDVKSGDVLLCGGMFLHRILGLEKLTDYMR